MARRDPATAAVPPIMKTGLRRRPGFRVQDAGDRSGGVGDWVSWCSMPLILSDAVQKGKTATRHACCSGLHCEPVVQKSKFERI